MAEQLLKRKLYGKRGCNIHSLACKQRSIAEKRLSKKNLTIFVRYFFIRNIYKPCLKALKIDYKPPKSGRHFFATISNQQGLNSKAITDMIGHTNIEFTKNQYTHTEDSFLKDEYEKIVVVFRNL